MDSVTSRLRSVTQGHARSGGDLNVAIDVPGIGSVLCSRVIRAIAGKRLACAGQGAQGKVIVKLYYSRRKAYLHWRKSDRGCRAFIERGIAAPGIIFSGYVPAHDIYAMVLEYLEDASRLDSALADAMTQAQRADILGRVSAALAAHHDAGILQQDLHLGNFMIGGGRVYSLDGDRVRLLRRPVDEVRSLENLALFLSNVPYQDIGEIETCIDAYAQARGIDLGPRERMRVRKRSWRIRSEALGAFMRKVLRSRDPFVARADKGLFAVFDSRNTDVDFSVLVDNGVHKDRPWTAKGGGYEVQDVGGKTFLCRTSWALGPLAAKGTFLATRLWKMAHMLNRIGVATPRPVALVLQGSAPLVWRCSVWFRPAHGVRLDEYLDSTLVPHEEKSRLAAGVTSALDLARAFNLVPSGLNPSDVIVSGADAVFMDPLAFRRHGVRGWLRREEGSGKVRALCMPFLQGMHP